MLEKDKYKEKINSIVNHIKNNDTTNATTELLACIDDYNAGFDELEIAKTQNTTLTDSNKELESKINSLKDVNMDLLLRVGSSQQTNVNTTPNKDNNEGEKQPRKFDDLFDEKGELKS